MSIEDPCVIMDSRYCWQGEPTGNFINANTMGNRWLWHSRIEDIEDAEWLRRKDQVAAATNTFDPSHCTKERLKRLDFIS